MYNATLLRFLRYIFYYIKIVLNNIYIFSLLQAIALLERINVKVHGVITGGAATNRKFWNIVGVCGKKSNLINSFIHPTVKGRKIYVFSDTPHLIKTIRNRLYKTDLQVKLL